MMKPVITFHYEGTRSSFNGPLHIGTIVDNESIEEEKQNTIPGLHIFTSHDVEQPTKDRLWQEVISYADQHFHKPYKVQIKTPHRTRTITIK